MSRGGKAKYAQDEHCHTPGCIRPVHARGLCMTHYMQWRRGKEADDLAELQSLVPAPEAIDEGVGVSRGTYPGHAVSVVLDALSKTAPADLAEYIERKIVLPPGHGYRGSQRMDFSVYSHMRLPLECVDNPDVEQITLCFAAQGGKTDTMVSIVGYLCGYRNINCMYVLPTSRMIKKVPRTRFEPVYNRSDVGFLKAENDYTLFRFYNGCFFSVALASSPDSTAEQTGTGAIIIDELDEYYPAKHDVVSLAKRRLTTAARKLTIIACTPKHLEQGYTYSYFESSRRYELEIQCPHCDHWFIPDFERDFRYPAGLDANTIKAHNLGYVMCPDCLGEISDSHHFDIVTKRKRWKCLDPHLPMLEVGFRMPAYLAPTKNWSETIAEFLQSADDPLRRADFWNSVIARPKRPDNLRDPALIEYKTLLGSWSQERLEIPAEVLYMTAGVDCGAHELWLSIYGWGLEGRKFVLRTELIQRAPGWNGWREATESLLALCEPGNYTPARNYLPPFEMGIIDAGDGSDTALIYDFCRDNPKWLPAKGYGALKKLYEFSDADPRNRHRGRYRGLRFVMHATHQMQDLFHTALQTAPGTPGSIQFAADAPAMLFVHIKNQIRVPVVIDKIETYRWQKIGSRPDHLRDACIGAMLAGIVCGFDKLAYAADVTPVNAPHEPEQAKPQPTIQHETYWEEEYDYGNSFTSRL